MEEPICDKCDRAVQIREGQDHTGICDECAQAHYMLFKAELDMRQKWTPTHLHVDGGKYRYIETCRMKVLDGDWFDGVIYETRDGEKCVTNIVRWHNRFVEIS